MDFLISAYGNILRFSTEIGKEVAFVVICGVLTLIKSWWKKRKVYKSNKWKAVEYNKEGKFLAYEGPFDELTQGKDIAYNEEKMGFVLKKAGLRIYLPKIDDTSSCENKEYQQVFLTNKKTWYKQIIWKKEHTLMAKEIN